LEETLEADISKLPKTGHFYFALTGIGSRSEPAQPVAPVLGNLREARGTIFVPHTDDVSLPTYK
jgi:hypothetical protein